MFNTQTKQSAFFTLFISAVLALSLTSCKNNSEKHTEQKSETIVKNKVKDINIPPQCDDKDVLRSASVTVFMVDNMIKNKELLNRDMGTMTTQEQNKVMEINFAPIVMSVAIMEANAFDEKTQTVNKEKLMNFVKSLSLKPESAEFADYFYAHSQFIDAGIKITNKYFQKSVVENIITIKEIDKASHCKASFKMDKHSTPIDFEYLAEYGNNGNIVIKPITDANTMVLNMMLNK